MEYKVIYGKQIGVGSLFEDFFTVKFDDSNIEHTIDFEHWADVSLEISYPHVNNKQYVQIEFKDFDGFLKGYLTKRENAEQIKNFYEKRNAKRKEEKANISSYIDSTLLEIAENLVNLAEEDIFTNYRIIIWCQHKYYNLYTNFSNNYYHNTLLKKECYYNIFKEEYCCKGKEKKEAEKFNEELRGKIKNLSDLIDNFVEIVIEKNQLKSNDYMGKIIAWKVIQRKLVEYYAARWKEEYEINLVDTFDELKEKMSGQKHDEIEKRYIYNVAINDEINMDQLKEVLIYYFLSKRYTDDTVLYEYFDYYYELIWSVKKTIKASDIKEKLQTKQKRKINTYTIDDVDLMSGNEFEEFVGMLFKKMGYSSQVTKQSGDQGLDVIAIRNGIKIGVQAKCYSNTVGNSAVQEAVAGKSFYNCDKVVVITNNYFTQSAVELAQSNNVILWNRDMLKEKLKEIN